VAIPQEEATGCLAVRAMSSLGWVFGLGVSNTLRPEVVLRGDRRSRTSPASSADAGPGVSETGRGPLRLSDPATLNTR
jgi:hypothetical protein